MTWDDILAIDTDDAAPLGERVNALFEQQRRTWPLLRDGEAALTHLQKRTLTADDGTIVVQMNPARRRSTQAKTDAAAVAQRPCFLCPQNMPAEERGVAFDDLVVMPNPFPILPGHCTIASREHEPQQFAPRVEQFLRLTQAIGPELAALYNGPRCGASAPDHLHFQAARADEIPAFAQLPAPAGATSPEPVESFGRRFFVLRGDEIEPLAAGLQSVLAALSAGMADSADGEPLVNVAARCVAGEWTVAIFPRIAHRPARYFADGPERLLVSPAVLEMGGILVATEPDDFARLDAALAREIYDEVSISAADFALVRGQITR